MCSSARARGLDTTRHEVDRHQPRLQRRAHRVARLRAVQLRALGPLFRDQLSVAVHFNAANRREVDRALQFGETIDANHLDRLIGRLGECPGTHPDARFASPGRLRVVVESGRKATREIFSEPEDQLVAPDVRIVMPIRLHMSVKTQ